MAAALLATWFTGTSSAQLQLTPIGGFASPIYATAPADDVSRLFVVEQGGAIRVFKDGDTLAEPFLDITGLVLAPNDRGADAEEGLLAMAFPPDYGASGRFYVLYVNQAGDVELDEFRRSIVRPDVANPSTRRVRARGPPCPGP